MPHYCFKQPNNKYTVWSTIVDAPILWNATKAEIWRYENVRDELEWKHWVKPTIEDAIDEGDIECSLCNGNITKEELLDYFNEIKYQGKLYKHAENFDLEAWREEIEEGRL